MQLMQMSICDSSQEPYPERVTSFATLCGGKTSSGAFGTVLRPGSFLSSTFSAAGVASRFSTPPGAEIGMPSGSCSAPGLPFLALLALDVEETRRSERPAPVAWHNARVPDAEPHRDPA